MEEKEDNYIDLNLEHYFDRSKMTIDVLIDNMVKPEDTINKHFQELYKEPTITNVIKILFRGTSLYEART